MNTPLDPNSAEVARMVESMPTKQEWSMEDWQRRVLALMDDFACVPGDSIGSFEWHRKATGKQYGFRLTITLPGQRQRRSAR